MLPSESLSLPSRLRGVLRHIFGPVERDTKRKTMECLLLELVGFLRKPQQNPRPCIFLVGWGRGGGAGRAHISRQAYIPNSPVAHGLYAPRLLLEMVSVCATYGAVQNRGLANPQSLKRNSCNPREGSCKADCVEQPRLNRNLANRSCLFSLGRCPLSSPAE